MKRNVVPHMTITYAWAVNHGWKHNLSTKNKILQQSCIIWLFEMLESNVPHCSSLTIWLASFLSFIHTSLTLQFYTNRCCELVFGYWLCNRHTVKLLQCKKNIAVNLFSKLGWELGLYYASYDDFHPDFSADVYLGELHCRGRERVFELEARSPWWTDC